MKKFFNKIKSAFKKPLKDNKQKTLFIMILLSSYIVASCIIAFILHWACLIPLFVILGLVVYVVMLDTKENIQIREQAEKLQYVLNQFKNGGD